ncbi:MAG TPA: hypothetical protein VFR04_09145 [Solirubrobacterales bacterium]|nr:hypothetical protein [Solirubrobacterales bacterium]
MISTPQDFEDGVERLATVIEGAIAGCSDTASRLSAGLHGGLECLAADPELAHRLLVAPFLAAPPARLEYEHQQERLAQVLGAALAGPDDSPPLAAGMAELLAAGVLSHLSGRVLAGEAGGLVESHELLLEFLLMSRPHAP